jgi:hypothetical protein
MIYAHTPRALGQAMAFVALLLLARGAAVAGSYTLNAIGLPGEVGALMASTTVVR